ncbi:TetR/AcrR family transcriptional regulator [Nocardiopsis trehalosi]|jgi:AcrR family transcriptional regulator|uniref:TetR/AcrR family transcriptional regulator n=1 Tax=Nocardiopsis trehalosi TaxID=109329 RepID=UPI000829DC77|nr:TetR/AcrR family transcriptional regulator [Nocardiopsis trehalosi]
MAAAPRTKAQQREETSRALVAAARRLFARHGYAAVALEEITAAAGVTKGALYHHFGSKAGIFRAVVAEVQHEVGERVAAAADAEPDPWDRLVTGCREFLAAGADPEAHRIMFVDGPAVLGWDAWRRIDEASSERHLAEQLAALAEAGIVRGPVAPLVHLLSGAMNEAALWLAQSPEGDPDETADALVRMLEALRAR